MSAILTPPTKTFGARPPIIPPTFTTFDGMNNNDDHREPLYKVIADRVDRLIQSASTWPHTSLDLLIRLLERQVKMIESELAMERMIDKQLLPPSAFGAAFPMDYIIADESEAARTYGNLLLNLHETILKVRGKNGLLKDLLPSSEG